MTADQWHAAALMVAYFAALVVGFVVVVRAVYRGDE